MKFGGATAKQWLGEQHVESLQRNGETFQSNNAKKVTRRHDRAQFNTIDELADWPAVLYKRAFEDHPYAATNLARFMRNLSDSLSDQGVMLIGTPNKSAEQYASEWSLQGHINLKTYETLDALCSTYFHNVFHFGMNDEVVHTSYAPMCPQRTCRNKSRIRNGR